MGPEILSSTGAGVWRKAPMAFPDSGSVLDKSRSAQPFLLRGRDYIISIHIESNKKEWETGFLPLLVLTRQGRSTGKNQHWQ